MEKTFYFIFILFFIGFVSAGDFSISPPQVNFEGETKQNICREFFITTPEKSILIGEDRWGEKEETRRKFSAHTFSSEDLNLEVNYPELIELNGEIKLNICILGKEEGNYHGLLLYKLGGAPTGIGIWLNVSLTKGNSLIKISGKVIEGVNENSKFNLALGGSLILVLVFFLLVTKLKYKPQKKTEFSNQ